MISGRFNIVTDGQWGSTGKGLISSYLAARHHPEILSSTNMPNAGHTAVNTDGAKFVAKAIPSGAMLNKWHSDYQPHILLGPSAAFDIDRLLHEIAQTGTNYSFSVHPRAGIVTEQHKKSEESGDDSTKHLASTMQGCGTFLAEKILRKQGLRLARDYPVLENYLVEHLPKKLSLNSATADIMKGMSMPQMLRYLMAKSGYTILHEGSQGFSLDINHGSHYPECTSRGTTALQNMADMGIAPDMVGDITLVIRPYPIRVGNVVEDGSTVGYSGDCYDDHEETSWAEVTKAAGAPPEVADGELTTVTKRLRRVFTFSEKQLKQAVVANGATEIALNFANYIDWSCYGTNVYSKLPDKVKDFIDRIEVATGVPVTMVGTGPQLNHVAFIGDT